MAKRIAPSRKQRTYLGTALMALGLVALAAACWLFAQPLTTLAASLKSPLGFVPTLGMCLLHATHAIAFHQVDYASLIARILVLFSAMVSLIAGIALQLPRAKRPHIFELALTPQFEGREMINGSR